MSCSKSEAECKGVRSRGDFGREEKFIIVIKRETVFEGTKH